MITIGATMLPGILTAWEKSLSFQLQMAIEDSCMLLEEIAHQQIADLGAHDTYAFEKSLYVSVHGFSTYEKACDEASEAYMNNETMWPEIKQVFGDTLRLDEEVKPDGPWEGYLGVAAFHGRFVEFGYTSFYKNPVAGRPVIGNTAAVGYPFVMARMKEATRLALK